MTNVRPIFKVKILYFLWEKYLTGPQHCLSLNCPSLHSGQFRGKKCLVHVEIFIEKEPLDTFPAKKNKFPALSKSLIAVSLAWEKVEQDF